MRLLPVVPLLVAATLIAGCGSGDGVALDGAATAREEGSVAKTVAAPVAAGAATSGPVSGRATWVKGVRVAAAGDVACSPGSKVTARTCRQGATARLVRALAPSTVLALGDLQYDAGRFAAFRGSYKPTWGTFKAKTKPVPGNHEYYTAGAAGYHRYFRKKSPGYRAVNLGTWRVYLLNGNCGAIDCAAQRTWLDEDLTAHPRSCSALVMHFPRYSSGAEHGSDASMSPFWRIGLAHGVDLALAGHEHDYERFAPMDASGHVRPRRGISSFVVGTGGRSLYAKGTTAPGSRYFRNDKFGVLLLSLGDGAFSWKFKPISGGVRDAGSRVCH